MSSVNVDVGIRNGPFKNGLDQMRAQAQAWGSDIKNTIAGAFAFGAVVSWFNSFREEFGRVDDLAKRFGQSAKSIQQVSAVAKVSGTDIEQLSTNLTKLTLEAASSADKFAAVGINAAEFATAGFDQQVLMLAKAFEDTNGSVEREVALMELLGAKGQDLLPLISKGVATLNEEFGKVPVVSDAALASITKFNDALDDLNTFAKTAVASSLGLLEHLGASVVAAKRTLFDGGSFSGNYQQIIEEAGMLDESPTAGKKRGPLGATAADRKAADDEKKKTAEALKALDEEMLKLARSRMTEEQKIADFKREQAIAAAAANDPSKNDIDRASAAKRVLEIQQQIEEGQRRIAKTKQDESDKAAEKAKKEAEEIAKAEAAAAEEENQQRLKKLDPKARIDELKKQQKELFADAERLKESDRKGAAEKKLEALKLNNEIDAAQKELDDAGKNKASRPGVVSSSLAAVGGGGGAYVSSFDPALNEARRQTSLLQQIATNTRTATGSGSGMNPF